jgi:multicomponent Na+:H+ antiporter subunit F
MIALVAALGALLTLALALPRLLLGPTLYDRVLSANVAAAMAALLCACGAAATGRGALIDVALALLFGALVVNVAVFKFFRARSFQPPLSQPAREES